MQAESTHPGSGTMRLTDAARKIHAEALLIDGHNDLPWELQKIANFSFDKVNISRINPQYQTDIPRLRQGGVKGQFWSAYAPPHLAKQAEAVQLTLNQIDLIHLMVKHYPDDFELALSASNISSISRAGKIACLIGVEGGHSIADSLAVLRNYYRLGVRYLTLTHSENTAWAESSSDSPLGFGLNEFGREVVHEMNRLGILVDISHCSERTVEDALACSRSPLIASHSSAKAIAQHERNLSDQMIQRIGANGGVIMVNFFSGYLLAETAQALADIFEVDRKLRHEYPNEVDFQQARQEWRKGILLDRDREGGLRQASVEDLVDHIDHIVNIAGIESVGLGSDYDGITLLPKHLEDVSSFPYITQELLNRGYSKKQIFKILGGNILRCLCTAEKQAM
jgi:membrane dipeptidase